MRVWMSEWQFGCCGDPFEIGSRVLWTLTEPDRAWLARILGARAATVTHQEDRHHTTAPDDAPDVPAQVERIWSVHCRYANSPDDGRRPVPDSAVLIPVTRITGDEHGLSDRPLVGYLIDLRT